MGVHHLAFAQNTVIAKSATYSSATTVMVISILDTTSGFVGSLGVQRPTATNLGTIIVTVHPFLPYYGYIGLKPHHVVTVDGLDPDPDRSPSCRLGSLGLCC